MEQTEQPVDFELEVQAVSLERPEYLSGDPTSRYPQRMQRR
jgi:hypothetical protein